MGAFRVPILLALATDLVSDVVLKSAQIEQWEMVKQG